MTDEQIIKALRLCAIDVDVCTEACPYYEDREYFDGDCIKQRTIDAIDLINRQKAEIDRFADIGKMYSEVRAEAIREFAERLKAAPYRFRQERTIYFDKPPITKMVLFVDDNDIDNLVKVMTEEQP